VANALDDADQAIAIDPKYAMAHVSKCFFLGEFGKYGQALGHCNKAVELTPKSAIAYNVRGGVKILLSDLSTYSIRWPLGKLIGRSVLISKLVMLMQ
jgi:tetratricopeptide (TPR) repeat protein